MNFFNLTINCSKHIRILIYYVSFIFFVGCTNSGNTNLHSESNTTSIPNESTQLPNIIFILADDLGYGDLSSYGHPYSKTPNLDLLAKEGLLFTNFYSSASTCSPSRVAFMTGRHPASFKLYNHEYILNNENTITRVLKNNGYNIGHVGKWHLGKYDESFGIDYFSPSQRQNIQLNAKDKTVFDDAFTFIKQNKESPFYINIWAHSTHYPIPQATNELRDLFKDLKIDKDKFGTWYVENKLNLLQSINVNIDSALINYLAEVYNFDIQIGKLINLLQELGLEENTIIIFSSDQGPGNIDLTKNNNNKYNMLGYSGRLRGEKHTYYEGGIKVPFIIKWPKKIKKNKIDSISVISALDFLPSICSILNIDISESKIDGLDKSSVLLGYPDTRKTPLFWRENVEHSKVTMLFNNYKMHELNNDSYSLFNIKADPYEKYDISKEHPDIVKTYKQKIEIWKSSLNNK